MDVPEVRARLKRLVSRHVRADEFKWRAAYGPDIPPPDWPRHVYRVLCGQVFAATGNPNPCSQVLGIALPGAYFEQFAVAQLAIQLAEGGGIPDQYGWFLTPSRAHFAKEPDGTYIPHPQRGTNRPGWRRSRVPRVMGSETGRWAIGRRPLPPQLLANLERIGFPLDIDGTHTVMGHFPNCRVACAARAAGRSTPWTRPSGWCGTATNRVPTRTKSGRKIGLKSRPNTRCMGLARG